jgi:hypothetical protein
MKLTTLLWILLAVLVAIVIYQKYFPFMEKFKNAKSSSAKASSAKASSAKPPVNTARSLADSDCRRERWPHNCNKKRASNGLRCEWNVGKAKCEAK